VIIDISKALNVPYPKNGSIYELILHCYIGVDFEDGLGIIEYDCTFLEDVVFEFSINELHPLKFLFCLEGSFEYNFENKAEWHKIPQYKNTIVASTKFNDHGLR